MLQVFSLEQKHCILIEVWIPFNWQSAYDSFFNGFCFKNMYFFENIKNDKWTANMQWNVIGAKLLVLRIHDKRDIYGRYVVLLERPSFLVKFYNAICGSKAGWDIVCFWHTKLWILPSFYNYSVSVSLQ